MKITLVLLFFVQAHPLFEMATIPAPTMSTQGFVTDLSGKLDSLLAYFFVSDYNQTQLYPGRVISLPQTIQSTGGKAQETADLLQKQLQQYFARYYTAVDVTVQPETDQTIDASINVDLLIRIVIRDGDRVGDFRRMVPVKNSKMSEIIRINNG